MAGRELLPVRVAARREEAIGIVGLDVVAQEAGARLPAFEAGAHVELHLPGGLVRAYSLCNPDDEGSRYRIAVQCGTDSRGGARAVHALRPGAALQIGAPRNHFALDLSAPQVLLLAGGIGITPIVAMADALHRHGRPFALHYCIASRERAAFMRALACAPYAGRVVLHDAGRGDRADLPALLRDQTDGTQAYVCGPERLLAGALDAAAAAGWAPGRLRFERFGAPAWTGSTAGATDGFEVQLGRNGPVVQVPAHQPITVALERAGFPIPVSCEQGVCGTCLTRVLEGEPEHRDHHLSAHEQAEGFMLPCCSRARSRRLVLDLPA